MNTRELHVYYALRRQQRRGLRSESDLPTKTDVRDVLDELDDPCVIDTDDALGALKPDTVIRDADGYVCERWQAGWMAVAFDEPYKPVLPVHVLALPEGAS